MGSARNSCTNASITVACGPEARTTPDVPPELMLKILQHLPQLDLRVFAQASRACYAHALEAGLCIRRDVIWTNEDGFGDSLEKLDLILDHAENKPGLNIAITVMTMPWGDDAAAEYHGDMKRLVASIRRGLPNLVRLQVPLTDYAPLCANEAPKLEAHSIYHPGLDVQSLIPPTLFNGRAPRLRKVDLSLTDTDSLQPIAAFSSVSHLKLSAGHITRPLALARLFPALRVLAIDARLGSALPTDPIDLRGLTALHHFALAGDTALLDDGSLALLREIPVFEHDPEHPADADPVWPAHTGELFGLVERRGEAGPPAISFVPREPGAGQWRRTVLLRSMPGDALPLADMPRIASSLVSLTIEASLVNALAQSSVVLDKLRELVVDVSRDSYLTGRLLDAVARVRCPALERVVLLSGAGAGAVSGPADPVARLRQALGRPTLQLVLVAGCTQSRLDAPLRGRTHLPQTASGVVSADWTGYDRCRFTDLFASSRWDEA